MWFVKDMSTPASPPLPFLAQRLALIAAGLPQPVAGHGVRDRAMASLILLIRTFFSRIVAQLEALAASLAAGPAPATSTAHHTPGTPLLPEPTAFTNQMQAPPAEPEMATPLAAAPNPGRIPRPKPAIDPAPAVRTSPGHTTDTPGSAPGAPPINQPPTLTQTPAALISPAFAETPDPSARAPPG